MTILVCERCGFGGYKGSVVRVNVLVDGKVRLDACLCGGCLDKMLTK